MANERLIERLMSDISELAKDIDQECDTWEHDCRACTYERRCGDEMSRLRSMLDKAKACKRDADKLIFCSECELLHECTYKEALEARKQEEIEEYIQQNGCTAETPSKAKHCIYCKHYFACSLVADLI